MSLSKQMNDLLGNVVTSLGKRLEKEDEFLKDGIIPHASTINACIMLLKHNEVTVTDDAETEMDGFAKMVEDRKAAIKNLQH